MEGPAQLRAGGLDLCRPVPLCNGCATAWASCKPPPKPGNWPLNQIPPSPCTWSLPSPVLARPHWDSHARGLLTGITRGTTHKELTRAVLESVAYQTRDLLDAMLLDLGARFAGERPVLRVDGGMAASDWTMQFMADILDIEVDRPACLETTAMGAAYLAGLDAGLYPEPEAFARSWAVERRFSPQMDAPTRGAKYAGWQDAVGKARYRRDLSACGSSSGATRPCVTTCRPLCPPAPCYQTGCAQCPARRRPRRMARTLAPSSNARRLWTPWPTASACCSLAMWW